MVSVVDPTKAEQTFSAHRYNDDLLLDPDSRAHARSEFPGIFHVLDDEALRTAFAPIDEAASGAKRKSRRFGIGAIIAATASLAAVSAEPVWHALPDPWPRLILLLSAALSLGSAVVAGAGVLYGRRKEEWLLSRLFTERLRQFHFQAWICNLPEIAHSVAGADAAREYVARRKQAVETYLFRLQGAGDGALAALLEPQGGDHLWLYEIASGQPVVPAGFDPAQLFSAYRTLRFEEQLGYAHHKLAKRPLTANLGRAPLRNQQQLLHMAWLLTFSALVIVDAGLLVTYLFEWHTVDAALVHVATLCLALVALAAKTLEEGLGLSQEIERYEDYASVVQDALRRFDAAGTPNERLRVMMEMERLSFEEMRSFLRTVDRSSFVL